MVVCCYVYCCQCLLPDVMCIHALYHLHFISQLYCALYLDSLCLVYCAIVSYQDAKGRVAIPHSHLPARICIFSLDLLSEMASAFITNTLQVNLDSVLGISNNEEMVNMFKALESTGLRDFLGCPSVLYEQELEQFFDTTLVQDDDITLAVGPQPLWLRNHNSGPAHRIMVKRLATSPHDPLGITDSACKNQSVVVSVQYGPFNPYIPIRSTTIGKSRVAIDPIAMHTSWRSNSDIASVTRLFVQESIKPTRHKLASWASTLTITCVVSGKYVAIPEDSFAGIFNLPTEGLTDLSEVPNNLVLQARTLFSKSSVPVQFSCKKRLMKYEFRLLNDILAKSITVKAGSFDAVTHERFLMMTAIHFGIKVNWSKILFEVLKEMVDRTTKRAKGFAAQICVLLKSDPAVTFGEAKTFSPLKILSAKTVNTYVATNKTMDARGETDEPEVAKVAIVRKKSVSKKRSVSTAIKDTAEVWEIAFKRNDFTYECPYLFSPTTSIIGALLNYGEALHLSKQENVVSLKFSKCFVGARGEFQPGCSVQPLFVPRQVLSFL
ncbi:hypothetical protein F511_18619 [Dorcoceras hygrometricum]|uniref:Dystroglycan-like n=1 Tax=Dorcoceras hygrometricum TaxID=472368 RepID=A0A2Z7A574_9LAMI|nr:hypothetical protein F511_18619 [Dorcoceras hygrometricum]